MNLDRFGLLLLLVLSTVVGQALIDVGGSFLGASVAHAISGAALDEEQIYQYHLGGAPGGRHDTPVSWPTIPARPSSP